MLAYMGKKKSAPGVTRTPDLLIRSQALGPYPYVRQLSQIFKAVIANVCPDWGPLGRIDVNRAAGLLPFLDLGGLPRRVTNTSQKVCNLA